jgi:Cd(II)/Pb(II)-responsive transcriptional regulator
MKIGELAEATQCTVETIRYYEKERLLPKPDRTTNNYRLYGPKHLERLRFIRNCRALGMSQEEVHALLSFVDKPSSNCESVNLLLDEHIAHVDVRIQELAVLKSQLTTLRKKCRSKRKTKECGILHGLSAMRFRVKESPATHLG